MAQPTVLMRHPEIDPEGRLDPATASSRAFEKLYRDRGWRIVDNDGRYVPTREEIEAMTGPQLDELLGPDHGIRLVDERRAAVLERYYPSPVEDEPLEPVADPATPPGS